MVGSVVLVRALFSLSLFSLLFLCSAILAVIDSSALARVEFTCSALALVQDECGQSDAAIATVAKAGKLIAPAASAAPLSLAFKERVLRYQARELNFRAC